LLLISTITVFAQKKDKLDDLLPKEHGELFYRGTNGKILSNEMNAAVVFDLHKTKEGFTIHEYKKTPEIGWIHLDEIYVTDVKPNFFKMDENFKITYREIVDSTNNKYIFKEYNEIKKLIRKGKTSNKIILSLEDTVTVYNEHEKIISMQFYKNNELIGNRNWHDDGSETISNVFFDCDEQPEYPGGANRLSANIKKSIIKLGVISEDYDFTSVNLSFIILSDGTVKDLVIKKDLIQISGNEAKEVEKQIKKWKPAKLNGSYVNLKYSIEVFFQ